MGSDIQEAFLVELSYAISQVAFSQVANAIVNELGEGVERNATIGEMCVEGNSREVKLNHTRNIWIEWPGQTIYTQIDHLL